MAFEFRMPDIGEGIHEGEIVKWFVKPGDEVKEDDTLCEIQNDKAVVEIPSPVEGKVEEIVVSEGSVAVVGDVLIRIDAPGYENLQFMSYIHDNMNMNEDWLDGFRYLTGIIILNGMGLKFMIDLVIEFEINLDGFEYE